MAKKPTVADLMVEIDALKRKVAALEGAKAPQARDIEREMFEAIKRAADQAEKERAARPWPTWPIHPMQPHYSPEPYWLREPNWPCGTILC
jgi:hypothetical protein